jgi:recombination protein RecA
MARKTKEQAENNKRREKLSKIIGEFNRNNKDNVIKFASDHEVKERLSFGIEAIDTNIGNGILMGNFSVIYGEVGCGKSASALSLIATSQKNGKICALIDLEHTWDTERAKLFGVNTDELVLIEECETAEEAMEISKTLAKENVVDLIVVDSVQAMSPHSEQYNTKAKTQDREIKEDEMALLAKKMGKFIRGTKDHIFKSKVAVFLIGQGRANIGGYGNKLVLTGGNALKHFAMLILYIRKGSSTDAPIQKVKEHTIKDGKESVKTVDKPIGFDIVFKIEKHKITGCKAEGTEWHTLFYYESGFTQPSEKDNLTEESE